MNYKVILFSVFSVLILISSCKSDMSENGTDLTDIPYSPSSYDLNLPSHFPQMYIPQDNPLTKEGTLLGRHLFYDPILSVDSTISCSSCHLPEFGFTDGRPLAIGVDGKVGKRSSMSLINIGFVQSGLFWDGRSNSLEEQAIHPIEDPLEMANTWENALKNLKEHASYPNMFRRAFGIKNTNDITKELVAKSLAQFQRTLISKDSKFDKIEQGLDFYSDLELMGLGIFFDDDPDLPDAECGHCHNIPLTSSDDFFNNGIQSSPDDFNGFADLGRGRVTNSIADNGKFRAPHLRNLKYRAPFMHNGQFSTLDEVIHHYISGGLPSPNKDPLLNDLQSNPLTPLHIRGLKAFIETFTDETFHNNPEFKSPFQ